METTDLKYLFNVIELLGEVVKLGKTVVDGALRHSWAKKAHAPDVHVRNTT